LYRRSLGSARERQDPAHAATLDGAVPSVDFDTAPAGNDAAAPRRSDAYAAIGAALDRAGVTWCRLRERGDSDEDDLLVAPASLATARRTLAGLGFRERRHPGHGSHRAFFGYDPVTDRWPKIDVVTALDYGRWQEWRTTLATGCLERRTRRSDPGEPRLEPDDAFWTLLLHELLDRPGTPPRRLDRLRMLAPAARVDGPGALAAGAMLPRTWPPDRVIATIGTGDAAAIEVLGRAFATGLGRHRPFEVRRRRATARILRRLDRFDPPFVRRGLTVALLGPDGAGKSSLAARLGQGGPMPRRTVYLGLYGGPRHVARQPGATGRPARSRVPGLGLARRLAAMWRGWLVGWWQMRRGRLVIFDRHPYDARLADRPAGSSRLRRAILGHALPAPDAVVVLDAPAELLYARKPEHPIERVQAQRAAYLDLASRLRGTVVVDVTGPLDDVARTVTAAAWGSGGGGGADS
jgi:hypothetical protein